MIDLHSHILPGLDHGARDWDEALEMCRIAVDDGITVMAATPHVSEAFPNTAPGILAAAGELRDRLAAASIPLEIVAGGDYHITPDLLKERPVTFDGSGRYFLLEFPYQVIPPNSDLFVAALVKAGMTPIVTHPERIFTLHGHEGKLAPLLEKGALVQLTAGSLTGDFGPECQRSGWKMLKNGWVHILATDAHWVEDRPPVLSKGVAAAAAVIGDEAARRLVFDNPRAVLDGRDI